MVPAFLNDDYVIRFAVCARNAADDDINFAWNVISEMATFVLAMCDTNTASQILREFQKIEVSTVLDNCTACMLFALY